MNKARVFLLALVSVFGLLVSNVFAGNAEHPKDAHYTESGFFDIHLCNWPDRDPFYMALYSTTKFKDIKSVELMNAQGKKFAELNMSKFKIIKAKKKPEKRVFISQVPLVKGFTDGWFSAKITFGDGTVHHAKDFVEHGLVSIASDLWPADKEKVADVPRVLKWSPIKGVSHYRVFIRDKWDENKAIFSSKVLDKPEVVLPKGVLNYGGYYSWRVHARDVNEDVKLGDFNLGSLSAWQEFSIGE